MALALTGIVAASVHRLLLAHQRAHQRQTALVEVQSNLRAAAAILPLELWEVTAGDSVESDLFAIDDTVIGYKAMRNLTFVCQSPVDLGGSGTIVLARDPWFGIRQLDHERDSLLVFAAADSATRADDFWVHANLAQPVTVGNACPAGVPSLTAIVNNVTPIGALQSVWVGAPVRGFELTQMTSYRDTYGDRWMGLRQFTKASGWGQIQPVLGPLMQGGLRFAFYDSTLSPTSDPRTVSLIQVTLIGRSQRPVRSGRGSVAHVADTLTTAIALRNNAR